MDTEVRFQIARDDIIAEIERQQRRVFLQRDLSKLLNEKRAFWRLPETMTVSEFVDLLLDTTPMQEIILPSSYGAPARRFTWGEPSPYEVALTLRSEAYLSHGTAVFLHGLTDQIPKAIYINKEQSPKPQSSMPPNQVRIDQAFRRQARESQLEYEMGAYRVRVLSGKNTKRLEVDTIEDPHGRLVAATKVERTLIDIAVRPNYAGGPYEILEAYRQAMDRMQVGVLLATLKKLDYLYPYHQAIGFLMERAGYEPRRYERLRELGLQFDFYLVHGMVATTFVPEWRLHVPEGF